MNSDLSQARPPEPAPPPSPVARFLASKAGSSPRTVETYEWLLKSYVQWNNNSFAINQDRYDQYILHLVKLGRRPNGNRVAAIALTEYARFLNIDTKAWQRLRPRDVIREALHPNEFQQLLAACPRFPNGPQRSFFFRFVTGTQLRIQEFIDLKWSDVDLVNQHLIIRSGKGGKARRIRMYQMERAAAWERLKQLYGPDITAEKARLIDDYVAPFNNRVQPRRWCVTTGEAAGLAVRHIHPHLLRHTGAVWLLKAGLNLRALQLRLGHKSLEVTSRYLQVSEEEMERQMRDVDFEQLG